MYTKNKKKEVIYFSLCFILKKFKLFKIFLSNDRSIK